jgi:hypothetical protein
LILNIPDRGIPQPLKLTREDGMRPVVIGLAVVAVLTSSLIGASGFGSVASAQPGCGGAAYQEPCDYDSMDEQEPPDDRWADEAEEYEESQQYARANEANEWAERYLATELAVATHWRSPFVVHDSETGKRQGELESMSTPVQRYRFDCDPNYVDAYSGGCVPADRDYDCWELRSWGIASIGVIQDWMLLDDDGDGVGCEPVDAGQEALSAIPGAGQDTALAALPEPACSTALRALLPTPEEMGLEWTLSSGTVTGVECRTLAEVAVSFQNPEQATADLESFGWLENIFQTQTYGGDIWISIHRFGTP